MAGKSAKQIRVVGIKVSLANEVAHVPICSFGHAHGFTLQTGGVTIAFEKLRIEADSDLGVPSRVLDLLGAVDRYPLAMRFDRDPSRLTLTLELASTAPTIAARLRQIPGVRRVSTIAAVRP